MNEEVKMKEQDGEKKDDSENEEVSKRGRDGKKEEAEEDSEKEDDEEEDNTRDQEEAENKKRRAVGEPRVSEMQGYEKDEIPKGYGAKINKCLCYFVIFLLLIIGKQS